MRISTESMFNSAATSVMGRQVDLARLTAQISSGRRILTPADDPVGAARVIELENAKTRSDQLRVNQANVTNTLSQAESLLGNISDAYADMQAVLTQAGNPTLSDGDRKSLATELAARRDALFAMSNSRDADGQLLFGSRVIQVGTSRDMDVSLNSSLLFGRVRDGNGVFAAAAAPTNTGAAAISAGTVTDAAALDGNSYDLIVRNAAGVRTYDVVNAANGVVISAGNPFTSSAEITVAGMRVKITGAPADGDTFHLKPAANRTAFEAIDAAVQALRQPVADDASRAKLAAGVSAGLAQVQQAAETAQLMRADTGAALKEIETLQAVAVMQDEQLQIQLAGLRDLDYAQAVTELAQRQLVLDASQKAYARILGRSLFDYL